MEPSDANFCHPYQPYGVQRDFMRDLYKTIDEGKVGIFESPTGTGKSLSLICGSLTWLRDHKRRALDGQIANVDDGDDPDWMIEAEREERRRGIIQQREELEARLSKARRQDQERKKRLAHHNRSIKRRRNEQSDAPSSAMENEDINFLPEEYESDDLSQNGPSSKHLKDQNSLCSSTTALLETLNGAKITTDELDLASNETRIIFCSRTHSQLSQFVKEVRRVKPPPSIISLDPEDRAEPSSTQDEEIVKHLSLGSRKNLCINPKVSGLGSAAAINERCLDLQKTGVSEEQKCQFLPKDNRDLVDSFRDHALAEIRDIEDLSNLGRDMKICPYYASRAAIGSSEILTLPYPLLLQKSAREALGVSVKDHVIIIDEAHNLMDAIADTYSCSISLLQLDTATSQLVVYVQKFKDRLKGKNRMYVTQIIRLLDSVSACLRSTASNTASSETIITPTQLLAGKGVDQIQPHIIIRYLRESKLASKVENYGQSRDELSANESIASSGRGALQLFQNFLAVLMNPSAEGRFFFGRDEQRNVSVRYILLDPREHFRDIVEEARAVILAGGTMAPLTDYRDYLFSYLPPDRLRTFSFGHVVPREHLFAQSIGVGPSGVEFDFTFERRKSDSMVVELGLLFIRACRVIPDGVVAFFPSYDYLAHVVSVWKKAAVPAASQSSQANTAASEKQTIFSTLNTIKPIFYETKPKPVQQPTHESKSRPTPQSPKQQRIQPSAVPPPKDPSLLSSYINAIDHGNPNSNTATKSSGALLLSITSGTLSEGINFSDNLGRAVFAIGLPYPNPHSASWQAKLEHIEQTQQQHQNANTHREKSNTTAAAKARAAYTTATTLRATNQSIGRAIRHRHDYAAIILVDRRFAVGGTVWNGLPGWIREGFDSDLLRRGRDRDRGHAGGGGGAGALDEDGLRGFFDSFL